MGTDGRIYDLEQELSRTKKALEKLKSEHVSAMTKFMFIRNKNAESLGLAVDSLERISRIKISDDSEIFKMRLAPIIAGQALDEIKEIQNG